MSDGSVLYRVQEGDTFQSIGQQHYGELREELSDVIGLVLARDLELRGEVALGADAAYLVGQDLLLPPPEQILQRYDIMRKEGSLPDQRSAGGSRAKQRAYKRTIEGREKRDPGEGLQPLSPAAVKGPGLGKGPRALSKERARESAGTTRAQALLLQALQRHFPVATSEATDPREDQRALIDALAEEKSATLLAALDESHLRRLVDAHFARTAIPGDLAQRISGEVVDALLAGRAKTQEAAPVSPGKPPLAAEARQAMSALIRDRFPKLNSQSQSSYRETLSKEYPRHLVGPLLRSFESTDVMEQWLDREMEAAGIGSWMNRDAICDWAKMTLGRVAVVEPMVRFLGEASAKGRRGAERMVRDTQARRIAAKLLLQQPPLQIPQALTELGIFSEALRDCLLQGGAEASQVEQLLMDAANQQLEALGRLEELATTAVRGRDPLFPVVETLLKSEEGRRILNLDNYGMEGAAFPFDEVETKSAAQEAIIEEIEAWDRSGEKWVVIVCGLALAVATGGITAPGVGLVTGALTGLPGLAGDIDLAQLTAGMEAAGLAEQGRAGEMTRAAVASYIIGVAVGAGVGKALEGAGFGEPMKDALEDWAAGSGSAMDGIVSMGTDMFAAQIAALASWGAEKAISPLSDAVVEKVAGTFASRRAFAAAVLQRERVDLEAQWHSVAGDRSDDAAARERSIELYCALRGTRLSPMSRHAIERDYAAWLKTALSAEKARATAQP